MGAALLLSGLATLWLPAARAQQGVGTADQNTFRINTLIERLEQGGIATTGRNGVWAFVDMEHSPYDITDLKRQFESFAEKRKPNGQLETTPFVRIPPYGQDVPNWVVKQVLDAGALGVVFPQVDTKEQTLRAIRAMRYPPQKGAKYPEPVGIRGWTFRERKMWGPVGGPQGQQEYLRRADVWPLNPDGELAAMIMIESPVGVKNINEILAVPGVTSILIGPADLGLNLGVGLPPTGLNAAYAPEEQAAIETVARACAAKKVICGIASGQTPMLTKLGFRVFFGGAAN